MDPQQPTSSQNPALQQAPQSTTPNQTPPQNTTQPQSTQPPKKGIGKMLVLLLGLLVLGVGAFFATRVLTQESSQEPLSATPQPTVYQLPEKLVVGIHATFEPMEFVDEKGEFAGLDVDLAKEIGKELGVAIEFKNLTWDKIFTSLLEGKIDMIVSSVSITEERKKIYSFSDAYLNNGTVILTRKDNTTITKPEDIKGKKIAVTDGTTNEEALLKYNDVENILPLTSDQAEQSIQDLIDGKIDARADDLTGATGFVKKHSELKIATDPFTVENYGIAFRKGDEELVKRVNGVLTKLKTQGVLDDIQQRWFK